MGHGEVGLKVQPSFVASDLSPPQVVIVHEHDCFENKVVGDGNNLFDQVWVIGRSHRINCDVNLFDENLHWLVHIVICAHALVVLFNITFGDFGVSGLEVRQHLQGGDVGVTDVLVMEVMYISLVDGITQQVFKGLVSAVVFAIQFCIQIMLDGDAADLQSGDTVRDGWRWSHVGRWYKSDGEAELAIPKMGVH